MEQTLPAALQDHVTLQGCLEALGNAPSNAGDSGALRSVKIARHLVLVKASSCFAQHDIKNRELTAVSGDNDPLKDDERFRVAEGMFAVGRAKLPALRTPFDVFARFIASRPLSNRRLQLLPSARAADLFLVCATSCSEAAALRAFEAIYVRNLHRIVRTQVRLLCSCDEDELRQLVRERLLIRHGHTPPRISEYSGAGPLRSWVGTIAIHMARNLARERKEVLAWAPDAICGAEDPEAALMGSECQSAVARALRAARCRLGESGWALLRRRYDEELSAAQIADLHGVHRATVARWLENAYAGLEQEIRRYLAGTHQLCRREVDAMIQQAMRRHEWAREPVLTIAGREPAHATALSISCDKTTLRDVCYVASDDTEPTFDLATKRIKSSSGSQSGD